VRKMMERIAKLCVLLVVVAAASVGAAEEDASAKEAQAPGSTDANESQEWNFPSVLDPVECSNYFHPHYQVNGRCAARAALLLPWRHASAAVFTLPTHCLDCMRRAVRFRKEVGCRLCCIPKAVKFFNAGFLPPSSMLACLKSTFSHPA
jgi:hypothetical protein